MNKETYNAIRDLLNSLSEKEFNNIIDVFSEVLINRKYHEIGEDWPEYDKRVEIYVKDLTEKDYVK